MDAFQFTELVEKLPNHGGGAFSVQRGFFSLWGLSGSLRKKPTLFEEKRWERRRSGFADSVMRQSFLRRGKEKLNDPPQNLTSCVSRVGSNL